MPSTEAEAVGLDRIVNACVKLRDRKTELTNELNAQISEIDEKLIYLKKILNDHCEAAGAESVRTSKGTFFRSVKTKYWTSDWESMNSIIMETGSIDLLEKRIHQSNMRTYLEENPDKLPMGLNADSEYTITVRRKK